jgi:hypothetical protein
VGRGWQWGCSGGESREQEGAAGLGLGIEGVGYNVGAGWWEGVCVNVARVCL